MFYFELQNNEQKVLFSNLRNYPEIDKLDVKLLVNTRIGNDWYLYRETSDFTLKVICTDNDAKNLTSNKRRTLALDVLLSVAQQLKSIDTSQRQHFDAIIHRFIHNLVNVNRKLKGSLQSLASEKAKDSESETFFISEIKRRIENNTFNAAKVVSQVSKRTADLDSQVTGLRLISGFSEGLKASLINIDLKQVVNRFILDLNDELEKTNSTASIDIRPGIIVRIDYDLLKFAFSQFIDNCSKYILPDSPLTFSVCKDSKKDITIVCKMTSLKIDEGEINNIFIENTRGKEARKFTEGNGLGMFMIRKAMTLMGGAIYAECDNSNIITRDGKEFGINSFFIKVNKA